MASERAMSKHNNSSDYDPEDKAEDETDVAHERRLIRQRQLIRDFLGGRYARTPDLFREYEARSLLAARLRYSRVLDPFILWRLAALFHPWSWRRLQPKAESSMWKLVLEPRRKGKKLSGRPRDKAIARNIADLRVQGKRMKSAVEEVQHKYGVSRETVYLAWREHRAEAQAAAEQEVMNYREWLSDDSKHDL